VSAFLEEIPHQRRNLGLAQRHDGVVSHSLTEIPINYQSIFLRQIRYSFRGNTIVIAKCFGHWPRRGRAALCPNIMVSFNEKLSSISLTVVNCASPHWLKRSKSTSSWFQWSSFRS